MAPNKRKKKPASNPARGFATTSTPSKTTHVTDEDEQPVEIGEVRDTAENGIKDVQPSTDTKATDNLTSGTALNIANMTPQQLEEHLEMSALQTLLEEHGARCKTDANRQAAELENERRQLRSQAHKVSTSAWLSEDMIEKIITTAERQSTMQGHSISQNFLSQDAMQETTLILRLWTLRQVLLALKLPQPQSAMMHVILLSLTGQVKTFKNYVWGLQEAFTWYATHSVAIGLPDYDYTPDAVAKVSDVRHKESNAQEKHPRNWKEKKQDQAVASEIPKNGDVVSSGPGDHDVDGNADKDSDDEDDDDNDPELLVQRYINLKTKLWKLEQDRGVSHRAKKLQSRLSQIQSDILFDQDRADSAWGLALPNIAAEYYRNQKRLRDAGKTNKAETEPTPQKIEPATQISDASVGPLQSSRGPNEDDGLFGDMFAVADTGTTTEAVEVENLITVKLLEFGKWTGTSPRKILEEACKQRDPSFRISSKPVQKTTHSTRTKMSIFWTSAQTVDRFCKEAIPTELELITDPYEWTLEMRGVSVSEPSQSEAYISTIFFFIVTMFDSNSSNLSLRFPSIWRELLSDLQERRQTLISQQDLKDLQELKSWIQQVQLTLDTTAKQDMSRIEESKLDIRAKRRTNLNSQLPSPKVLETWQNRINTPAFQKMQTVRSQLPVHEHREAILEAISQNPVTIICAETGAGKSSGIPVLLLEQQLNSGKDTKILITQPRRISAVTLARRVSEELGERKDDLGTNRSLVGYAIRLESKTSGSTRITYATTGVLLRMLEDNAELEGVDYLMLDEIHERTIDLDLIFIAIQRLQKRQAGSRNLKIILMSATVDARKMSVYFDNAPILDLPGRTFPVDTRFLEDAIEATIDLKGAANGFGTPVDTDEEDSEHRNSSDKSLAMDLTKYNPATRSLVAKYDEYRIDYQLIAKTCLAIATKPEFTEYSSAILIFVPGMGEIQRTQNAITSLDYFSRSREWVFHQLHSSFSTEDLEKAFQRPPSGCRKIVIATNIAETGITIPDITAVIDTCKEKVMRFDERRQMSKLNESFISRASARQRKGRGQEYGQGYVSIW